MHIDAYLKRIGYAGPTEPTAETLRALQRAHMMAVPFENLDIPMGYPITVSVERFYDKIVRRRRGGFCYELNGLFSWLLGQLGFDVTLLSARVFSAEGKLGPEFDHLTLLVRLEERLIADVGFGDFALQPLPLDSEEPVRQHGDSLRLSRSGDLRSFERRRGAAPDWEPRYLFSLTPRRLEEYSEMCQYQQTSPESTFTKKTVCSLATPEGRITLTHDRLIMTADGERQEREIAGEAEYRALLREHFGVELDRHDPIHRLMRRGESA